MAERLEVPVKYCKLLTSAFMKKRGGEIIKIKNLFTHDISDDPRVFQLMPMWGPETAERWPIGVVWFATYLVFLGTSYGTKATYSSAITSFNTIFALLNIPTPFKQVKDLPRAQVDVFMALAMMASHKAASTCRGAKSAAEDAWLLLGNTGPIIDPIL